MGRSYKDVNSFKSNLDNFKKRAINRSDDYFWEVSNIIIDKIEGCQNYSANKSKFNEYLSKNPYVARRKGINF